MPFGDFNKTHAPTKCRCSVAEVQMNKGTFVDLKGACTMSGNVVHRLFGRITWSGCAWPWSRRGRCGVACGKGAHGTAPHALVNRTPKTPSALTALNGAVQKKFMGARNDRNHAGDVGVLLGGCANIAFEFLKWTCMWRLAAAIVNKGVGRVTLPPRIVCSRERQRMQKWKVVLLLLLTQHSFVRLGAQP